MKALVLAVTACALGLSAGCYDAPAPTAERRPAPPPTVSVADLPGHAGLAVDTSPKQAPRAMAAESYLKSYQMLFGGIAPAEIARLAKGEDGAALFDTWSSALGALGLPDYALDIPRATESNALMIADYERLGIALCDRAVERDLRGGTPRVVFDFTPSTSPLDRTSFDRGFERLHLRFLGYPSRLAAGRADRFFALYTEVVNRHAAPGAPSSRFSPTEAGWAVVCYGLVRHPEFHLY
jgi:hypothetical protein